MKKRMAVTEYYKQLVSSLLEKDERQLDFFIKFLKENMYIKYSAWEWENEYRILKHADKTITGERAPHKQLGIRLSRVISGIHCNDDNQIKLKRICHDLGIEYGHAVLHKREFGIDIIDS